MVILFRLKKYIVRRKYLVINFILRKAFKTVAFLETNDKFTKIRQTNDEVLAWNQFTNTSRYILCYKKLPS